MAKKKKPALKPTALQMQRAAASILSATALANAKKSAAKKKEPFVITERNGIKYLDFRKSFVSGFWPNLDFHPRIRLSV
jgi:hypothetical protein